MHFPHGVGQKVDVAEHPTVLVVGSVNIDHGFLVPRIPQAGESLASTETFISGGGKGANQAVAAQRLGAEVTLLAAVGADAEPALVDLRESGISLDAVVHLDEIPTGRAMLLISPEDNVIIVDAGANAQLTSAHVLDVHTTFPAPAAVIVQNEVPEEVVATTIRSFAERTRILFNPSPFRPIPEDLRRLVDVLVVNETELGLLFGLGSDVGVEKARHTLEAEAGNGFSDIVVTLGEAGVLVRSGGRVEHLPALRVEAVDTVGAGDTFLGALAVELGRGSPLASAAWYAAAAAAFAVTTVGARSPLLDRAAVAELIAAHGPEPTTPA